MAPISWRKMPKRTARARLVLDVEKELHKKLKTIALERRQKFKKTNALSDRKNPERKRQKKNIKTNQ